MRLERKLTITGLARCREAAGEYLARIGTIPLKSAVLDRASQSMPVPIGTLDAIHLASALLWIEHRREPLVLLTHDRQLAAAARASGLEVRP